MPYKVNLSKMLWEAPPGRCWLQEPNTGNLCAIGKVIAGITGKTNFRNELMNGEYDKDVQSIYEEILSTQYGREAQEWNDNFENERVSLKDRHEQALRHLLEGGLRNKLFELEDSDLELVKELKQHTPGGVKEIQHV